MAEASPHDSTAPAPGWTRGALREHGVAVLQRAGIEEARRNVEWMLEELLGLRRAMLYAYPEAGVPPEAAARFEAWLGRRAAREPVQYIIGHTDFCGLRLRVTPDVLIPRPETEQVVEAALRLVEGRAAPRVLDVGTGTGCMALALAQARPDARVYACDVSAGALRVAGANARALGLSIRLFQADLFSPAFGETAPRRLDLLMSNPPYVPLSEADLLEPEVREHEPAAALFTGGDPLQFYRALTDVAPALLAPGGYVAFETHTEHGPAAAALLVRAGFADVRLQADYAGHARILTARLSG